MVYSVDRNGIDLLQWGRACEDADSRFSQAIRTTSSDASMGPRL